MGHLFLEFISSTKVYTCKCGTHLSSYDALISKNFQAQSGKAYLFEEIVNYNVGEKANKHMRTGLHTVADVFCINCEEVVGWKYFVAFSESEKYKEGKFVLEKAKLNVCYDELQKDNWRVEDCLINKENSSMMYESDSQPSSQFLN